MLIQITILILLSGCQLELSRKILLHYHSRFRMKLLLISKSHIMILNASVIFPELKLIVLLPHHKSIGVEDTVDCAITALVH